MPWLTVGKKRKIIYGNETPANELLRKQPRSKTFELFIFGDSIAKKIDPSFIARCDKSLALNCLVEGAEVRGVYEQMRTFLSRSCRNKCNNPSRHKSPSQRPP